MALRTSSFPSAMHDLLPSGHPRVPLCVPRRQQAVRVRQDAPRSVSLWLAYGWLLAMLLVFAVVFGAALVAGR